MPTGMFSSSDEFWSSDPVVRQSSGMYKGLTLAGTMAAAGFAARGAMATRLGTHTAFDHTQNIVRRAGYASPFALLNTFRSAEFMSPFATTGSHGLPTVTSKFDKSKQVVRYTYGADYLNEPTKKALEVTFPKIEDIRMNKKALDFDLNKGNVEVFMEADPRSNLGSLYIRNTKTGDHDIISDRVSLFEMRSTETGTASKVGSKSKIHPAYQSILQASGRYGDFYDLAKSQKSSIESTIEEIGSFRDDKGLLTKKRFGFIKTPGLNEAGSLYAKAFPAYGMERINRLLHQTMEQVPILDRMGHAIDRAFNFKFGVKTGSGSKMFARYGIRAAAVSGAYLGVEQLDWMRRNYSVVGDFGVSAAFGAATALLSKRIFSKLGATKSVGVGIGAFAAQVILPGFEKGIFPGLATTLTNVDVATTAIGEMTFMNSYRRTVEGFLPGFTNPTISAGFGVAAMLASGVGADPISAKVFRRLNAQQKKSLFGSPTITAMNELPFTRKRLQMVGWQGMTQGEWLSPEARGLLSTSFSSGGLGFDIDPSIDSPSFIARRKVEQGFFSRAYSVAGADGVHALERELYLQYHSSLDKRRELDTVTNVFNDSYYSKLEKINLDREAGHIGRVEGFLQKSKSKVVNAFFGASFQGQKAIDNPLTKNWLGRYPALFAAGFLTHSLLSGGLLGSNKTSSEKAAEYSGKELVAIKKSRYWEGGGTAFEGGETAYYRPHLYHTYMNRLNQKSVWGQDEDLFSPIKKFFLSNFTYELERRNYYNRPYPITGGAFENVPIIGGFLASTIGRIIKPPRLMHTADWLKIGPDGEVQYKTQPEIDRPAYSLGGLSHGAPVSPFTAEKVLTRSQYQFRELEGLTGFAKNTLQKGLTGQDVFGLDAPTMQTAATMTSMIENFWEMELGGALFLSEPIRRFLPRKRSEIMEYNPIQNDMPSWLPERFHHGDPYRNLQFGSARLPGSGYASLHPELQSLDPEAYPDIYKYKILSDVAPTSREFRNLRERMYKRRAQGTLSESETSLMDESDKYLNKRNISLHSVTDPNANNIPGLSRATQALYGGGVDLLKDTVSPIEYMIPMGFRPTQKLLPYSNAVDQYEYQRLYGTTFAFWDKPVRDWFRPMFWSAAHAAGFDGTPTYRQRSNEISEHFDKLEFVKHMKLAQIAEQQGDGRAKRTHLSNAQRTKYGINPQASAMGIYQALPDGEKAFFDAFANAKGVERERILEMVPADQVDLYQNIYSRIDQGDDSLYGVGGGKVSEEYLQERLQELQPYFKDKSMPADDWIGWHEQADLEDIKVRYVNSLGIDLYDVDMYDKKLRAQKRRAYLDGSIEALHSGQSMPGSTFAGDITRRLVQAENPGYFSDINTFSFGSQNRSFFHINDDRRGEMINLMRGAYE